MKSFGIYYKKEEGQTGEVGSSEVQINVWKLSVNKQKSYFIDFGLQFNPCIKEISVFVPFHTDSSHVKDLGSLISKDGDLISRLFNTNTTSNHTTQSTHTLVSKDDGNKFEICSLDVDNKTGFTYLKDGDKSYTLITFSVPQKIEPRKQESENNKSTTAAETKKTDCYVRFRIIVDDNSLISRTEDVANDVVQSAFSKLELFDIRLNDARYIPSNATQIIYHDKKCDAFYFQKVHFFYMVDVREPIQTTSPACHDSRFLEYIDWKGYLDNEEIKDNNFLSYHWKKVKTNTSDASIKSFQLCYSCLFPNRDTKQLLAYAGLAIILGFIGSMLCFSFSSLFSNVPSWTLWFKVGAIGLIAILEAFYFWFFNKRG